MKKYVAPAIEIVSFDSVSIIALSLKDDITTPEQQLSNRMDEQMEWDD